MDECNKIDDLDDFYRVELALLFPCMLLIFLIEIQAHIALAESLLAEHVKDQRRLNRSLPIQFVLHGNCFH